MLQDWTIYSWYCPNCKTEVCGIKDKKDQIKVKCERCGVHMVRKSIGRRHLQIDIYAPDYNESSEVSVGKGYEVSILMNATYQQFISA